MLATSTRGAIWPSRFAYAAAAIFLSASGATNLIYGWQKGTDVPTSLVWAAVSLAVSILFALAWPALLRSIDAKSWSRAAMIAVGLLLSGSYSIAAALGSASGGRLNATAIEQTTRDDRQRSQRAYDAATAELAKLPAARPVAELEGLLSGAKPTCRVIVTSNRRDTVCVPNAALTAELGRSRKRAELQAAIDKAAGELKAGPPRAANTDARTISRYLSAVGVDATPNQLDDLLTLLAVLVIECGGGLALAVGMSLSGPGGHAPDTRTSTRTDHGRTAGHVGPDTPPDTCIAMVQARPPPPDMPLQPAPDMIDKSAAGVRFLAFLRERGGVLVSGQREMGRALGWSKSWTHEVLHDLAGAGLIRLTTGKSGTVVRFAA